MMSYDVVTLLPIILSCVIQQNLQSHIDHSNIIVKPLTVCWP